jgi:sulfatase modifying factor 1
MNASIRKLSAVLTLLALTNPARSAEVIENFLGMRFVPIPAGEFIMGTEDIASARHEVPDPALDALMDETPAHKVIISTPFYLGETEVTQQTWLQVMENRPGPAAFWRRKDWQALPVTAVSWFMAERFIEELNTLDTRHRYRLPTEAEWEYAARAGTQGLRPFPDEQLEDFAWFIDNSGDEPHPVAGRKPNAFGLYDMLGNLWEWVSDWYAPETYTGQTRVDPQGPATGWGKARRGGSYHCPARLIRPAYRAAKPPGAQYSVIGLRLVAEPKQQGGETPPGR